MQFHQKVAAWECTELVSFWVCNSFVSSVRRHGALSVAPTLYKHLLNQNNWLNQNAIGSTKTAELNKIVEPKPDWLNQNTGNV